MTDVIDMTKRRIGQLLTERFAEEDDDEHDEAYYQSQEAGREEATAYSETLGMTLSAQCVAMGAMRLAFETGGKARVLEAMRDLQEAVDEWTKEP